MSDILKKTHIRRNRLSIDLLPEEHRQIKIYAAMYGKTIREYILEILQERLRAETAENKELLRLTMHLDQDPVLKELWDNQKDAEYDRL